MTSPTLLFAICTAVWGTTWLAITFQLGTVDPAVSVVYRFALAALLLMAWCRATGRPLSFDGRTHARLALWGATYFGLNYVAVYHAERFVASGLVAVVFSAIVFTSAIGMRVFFGTPLTARILAAATLGCAGVALLFLPGIAVEGLGRTALAGLAFAVVSMLLATAGNLVAVRNQRDGLPLVPATAWGMAWGAGVAALSAVATGAEWTFDARPAYVASLLYLAAFGSIVAFLCYLTLLGQVGAGPASYVGVSTPVVAMLVSTAFEGYRWDAWAIAGVALAVAGNVLALRRKPG
jgi:drug/metabolite transporter (DMT)-like permease